MAQNIYLSTYSLKVYDRKAEVHLKNFNGPEDFFDFFKEFMDEIYQNVKKAHSFKDKVVLHLTLDKPVIRDKNTRVFYGYFSSGVGGDKYKVRANGETDTAFESDPDKHVTFRDLFFYLQLPADKNFGYLIIQKKRDLGVKGLIEKALNLYLKEMGFNDYRASISNMLNGRVFDRMMSNGNLKNIDFIKKSIPSTIDDLFENGLKNDKGTLTTSIRAPFSLGPYWKELITNLFNKEYKENIIELQDGLDSLDEIEFELELKGKKKTFHVFAKHRTQPDVEVSEELEFEQNEPTLKSLVKASENLITDMLILTPNVPTN